MLSSERIARACDIARAGPMMATCGRACASWRGSVGGSAIAACISCSAGTASPSTARRPSGSIVRIGPDQALIRRIIAPARLTVRRRKGRRRAVGARAPAPVLALPNQRWSLDFVHDQLVTGRRFRVLNIVDDVTRECLAAVIDTSISGRRVVRELGDLIVRRGAPKMIPDQVRDQRQRDGADVERGAGLVRRCRDRVALYRTRQTNAERVRREL